MTLVDSVFIPRLRVPILKRRESPSSVADDSFGKYCDVIKSLKTLGEESESSSLGSSLHDLTEESVNTGGITSQDCLLLTQAEALYKEDKLLEAARILGKLDARFLDPFHLSIIRKAKLGEELMKDLTSSLDDGWSKQSGTHGSSHESFIFHRFDETKTKLTVRVESVIEQSLVVPLLSVLNETELFATWLPHWKTPRFRISQSTKLRQSGRCSQEILVGVDPPWPLQRREVALSAVGFDDIDTNGIIAIRLDSVRGGKNVDGLVIPEPEGKGTVRIDFRGGFLFRRCPTNHSLLIQQTDRKRHARKQKKTGAADKEEEEPLLVSFSMYNDAKLDVIPKPLMNFILRTVIAKVWNRLLKVAEDVRSGKRPMHSKAIENKRATLYDWVDDRVKVMFDLFDQENAIA